MQTSSTLVGLLDQDRGMASVLSPEDLATARRYAVAELVGATGGLIQDCDSVT